VKIDDETVSDNQMKQGVIRVKRDDVDVLGTAVYLPAGRRGPYVQWCERAEVVNIDYLTLLDYGFVLDSSGNLF